MARVDKVQWLQNAGATEFRQSSLTYVSWI